jgi:hypothetical protein
MQIKAPQGLQGRLAYRRRALPMQARTGYSILHGYNCALLHCAMGIITVGRLLPAFAFSTPKSLFHILQVGCILILLRSYSMLA